MSKNGSVATRHSGRSVANKHTDSGSVDSVEPAHVDHSPPPEHLSHQSGETVDPADDHHSCEEGDGGVEDEDANLLQEQGIFQLAYGYIYFCKGSGKKAATASLPDENSPLDQPKSSDGNETQETNKNGGGGPTFRFVGQKCNQSIHLFGNQMTKLVRELRNAYKAYHQADDTYKFVVSENETHRVTLEVSLYKEKTYLFLKRYFKSKDGYNGPFAGMYSSDDWIPTKSVVSLDPEKDVPTKILRYALLCCR